MTSPHQQPSPATASTPRVAAAGHQTQVQALARYAARATFDDLSAQSRQQLPVPILDCLAPAETCHTADNFGVALTAAELAGGTGRDLMLGVALGYTVQSRLVDHGNFMTRGFDHTAQLAFSHNAAAGRLLGMTAAQIANAIAMAASSDASFAVIRPKPLSQWKGLASAQSAL